MQGNRLISGQFRKNRSEKPSDSRRFQQNSLRERTGNFSGEQGIKVPCSAENRDNAPPARHPSAAQIQFVAAEPFALDVRLF